MIDLHCHTTYSDGSYSVLELLKLAQQIGLSVLSITDHNSVQAYQELNDKNIRNLYTGKIIPGVELTTSYKGEIIEILGYNFDIEKMKKFLQDNVLTFEEKQIKEFELIKKQYRKIGVVFNEHNINYDPKKESCRFSFVNEIKKYKENNKYFLNLGSSDDVNKFTRNELYNPKSLLYVDETALYPCLEKTIDIIHKSGGLAFLAHTYAYSSNISNELLDIISNYDLDGLECFYTTFTDEQSNYLVKLCEKSNMFMSGGSDFHGTRKNNHDLGFGNGTLHIAESVVNDWVKKYI